MKPLACIALTAVSLATMAAAMPAMAQTAEIKHAVARLVVIPEDRTDIGVEIVQGTSSLPRIQVTRRGNKVEINGGLESGRSGSSRVRINQCRYGNQNGRQPGEGASVEVERYGRIALEQAPLIVLRTPRKVDVKAGGAVFGSVGSGANELDLASGGCGHWTVGHVDGPAEVSIGGSGHVRMGNSRSLETNIGGSGSVTARSTGGLEANIGGSGSVQLERVDGPIDVSIGGSGDVRIRQGRAETMEVSVAGSGDVRFDGTVHSLTVAMVGSGDVRVREVTGPVSRTSMGSGKVYIGQ